jgi:hypothetical protein
MIGPEPQSNEELMTGMGIFPLFMELKAGLVMVLC